jgi:2-polyprenyl-6-hydroxyphenyl methylase/3-demethylubiquinone-9 3-methyltransferase
MKDGLDDAWPAAATVDPVEVARFDALAEEWWNPQGAFKPVHAFNAARRDYIIDVIDRHFVRDTQGPADFRGLRILDVGCGAGLLCEPLADLGAEMVGIDAAARNIAIARRHAAETGRRIDYRHQLAQHVAAEDERFDVVLNTEVIEHVADPAGLMRDCGMLVIPGGLMIVATLNRTLRAYFLAIVGAEYVLRWLPKGTHDWRRFLRPEEIRRMIQPYGLRTIEETGVTYNPLRRHWRLSRDTGVNYMLAAVKAVA